VQRVVYLFLLAPVLSSTMLSGCYYDEGLTIENMTGTVVIPREAATRDFVREGDEGDTVETITDVRLIGPVYLGMFAGVEEGIEDYPHPSVGPQYQAGVPGDTYPYGSTTVGDIRYACFEHLTCKVVSGRYLDFDSMVEWFRDVLEQPIMDNLGNEVTNGDFIRQTCYEYLNVTTDEEIQVTAMDSNDDGVVDLNDLDFVEGSDGNFYAEFDFWQQEYFEEQGGEEGSSKGFSLWGWMDAPSQSSLRYGTCNSSDGYQEQTYNNDFFGGQQYDDLINLPANYISDGDWVSTTGYTYESPFDTPELWIDFEVE
jgi:hypothetical protein